LIACERRAKRVRQPRINLELFRSRDFSVGLLFNATLFATFSSFFFVLGLYLQDGRGDSPLTAGPSFVPLWGTSWPVCAPAGSSPATAATCSPAAPPCRSWPLGLLVGVTTWSASLGFLLIPAVFVFGLGQGR
jgi:hypothetical protein